jgi:hypothetical protein
LLIEDAQRPRKEKRTAQRLHDALVRAGFSGSYPTVQRFVKAWIEEQRHSPGTVFIPQSFAPGEAYQFDWSYETVALEKPESRRSSLGRWSRPEVLLQLTALQIGILLIKLLDSRSGTNTLHSRAGNATRDRDSSHWTAWWSKLNSNFRAV